MLSEFPQHIADITCCKGCKERYRRKVGKRTIPCQDECKRYKAERAKRDKYIDDKRKEQDENFFFAEVLKPKDKPRKWHK